MKKLLFLFIAVLLASNFMSCAPSIYQQGETHMTFLDFKTFQDQGVMISPYDCATKKYASIGDISVVCIPEIKTGKVATADVDDVYAGVANKTTYHVQKLDVHTAVQRIVDKVLEEGGNALFNFQYRFIDVPTPLPHQILEVSGFAVKLDE